MSQPPLVGRDAHRAQIHAWLTARLGRDSGTAPACFVSGEAGVGKTALLTSSIEDAGLEGVEIRRAVAVPWHPSPYGVLAQIAPSVLTQIAPSVAAAHRTTAVQPDAVRAELLAVGRPVVVVLDDLHWSDDATLELLPSLIDAVAGDPIAVLSAYRGDELPRGHLLRRVRTQLRHRRQLSEIALGPLDDTAIPVLITALIGRPPTAALAIAVADRTDGLPFFVEELLAALDAAGWLAPDGERVDLAGSGGLPLPDTIRDAVLLRVAGLPAPSRAALDVAAAIGVEFSATTVAALADDDWPDDLDQCGLITVGVGDERRFRHALAQEAIYAEVPWSRRRALHRAVADRLTSEGGPSVAVARHLLAAHDLDRARPALVAAAAEHMRSAAYRDAARLLTTALDAWPVAADEPARLAAVDRLAHCAELSGEHTSAITSLRELADRRAGRPDVAEVQRRLATQYELLGQWPLALSARESAADAFTAAGLPGDAAAERLSVAAHLRSAASFRAALDVLDVAEASALAAERTDLICRIGGLRGNVLSRMGRAGDGVPVVRDALQLALDNRLAAPASEIYQRLADSLEHSGDYRAAGRAYDTAYEFCQAYDQSALGQLCHACATVVLFQNGRWDRALTLCGEVLADPVAAAHARAVASGVAGLVHAMRGQTTAARAGLLESRSTAVRIDLVAMELLSTWGLALLDEDTGRTARAVENYRHVIERCRTTEERHYCVPVLQFAVARFVADDRVADLGAAMELLAEADATTGQPEARAAFSYALGESSLAGNAPDQAIGHMRRALDLLSGLELPLVDAHVRHRTAVALYASGQRAEAAAALHDAHRTAKRLKARLLVERMRPDLDTMGAPSHSGATALLTSRESQVLRLVGDGLTSREIGRRVFLSPRTVEMHISNAMVKLDCRTRAEAVRRLIHDDAAAP